MSEPTQAAGQPAAVRASGRRRPRARLIAGLTLAVLGFAVTAAGLVSLSQAVSRAVAPAREATLPADAQRFLFDRRAWASIPVDSVFPPVYHSATAAPMSGAHRDFTRIGVAAPADCRTAFDPGLARLLSGHPCGPVVRVDYTDASSTLVATVGVAVLGTTPEDQRDLSAATSGRHDDLRPRAVAFPGTAAAGFGDAQRMAFRAGASDHSPFLTFAVVGFGDGRPATADPGQDVLDQSGGQLAAIDLQAMLDARVEAAVDDRWAHRA